MYAANWTLVSAFMKRSYFNTWILIPFTGLLDLLASGDQVLADRGFLLHEEFFAKDVQLITPSFTKGMKQLPQELVCWSRRISSSRIIVERAIGHIKKWRIMTDTVPHFLRKDYSNILAVVAGLTNMMQPLVNVWEAWERPAVRTGCDIIQSCVEHRVIKKAIEFLEIIYCVMKLQNLHDYSAWLLMT